MSLTTENILQATNGGLTVFRHVLQGEWKIGKSFLNPLYSDKKASCYVYFDQKQRIYKIKDFGDAEFSGDCFFLIGKILNKNCSSSQEFIEILKYIDGSLNLNLQSGTNMGQEFRKQILPSGKEVKEIPQILKQEIIIPYNPPITKEFSDLELSFWNQYGITGPILNLFTVRSILEFDAINKDGNPYKLKNSFQEPMFGYLGKRYIKLYRPKSKLRFLYAGDLKDGYVFGLEQLPVRGDILFITGGEKDVMSLTAKGFHAICFNSETVNIPKSTIKRLSTRFKHIVLLYDCDPTGLDSMQKHQGMLKEFDLKILKLPLAGTKTEKDISDFFRMGKTYQDLMDLFCIVLDVLYEETMAILKSCEIDFNNPPIKPEPLITINEVTVGSPGNLLCITGSEGSGKSNYLGGLIAGAIGNDDDDIDTLGTYVKSNTEGKAVIVYDTEQSEDQLFKNLNYILKRSQLPRPPKWFKAYCMVGMSRKDRLQSIFQSMDKYHYQFKGIHMVVIDGIADLLDTVNDEEKSVGLIDELFRLSGIYKTCIVCVLHLSPSGMKLRGHLGSEMQRKAAGILSIEKEEETNTSVVKAIKVRDGSPLEVPLIQFAWSKEKNHHVFVGTKSKADTENRRMVELMGIARDIYSRNSSYSYKDLVLEIQQALTIQPRMAKEYVRLLKFNQIVEKENGKNGEYRLIISLFS